MPSHLIINDQPLLVLPSLAAAIGLNPAIVLQQFHFLCSNKANGRVIDGERWVFDTYAALRENHFPFWSEDTIQEIITSLEKQGWLVSCQPEGVMSRRKYYRLSVQVSIYLTPERLDEMRTEREKRVSRKRKPDATTRETVNDGHEPRTRVDSTFDEGHSLLPLTETSSETSEPKNTRGASAEAPQVNDSASKQAESGKPTWEQVRREANRLSLPASSVKRFWLVNEYHGWRIKGKPMKRWKMALATFIAADASGKGTQTLDKTTPPEFTAWVHETYPEEEDQEHVRAWIVACKRNDWKKVNRITGELEPISDYRAACSAFVDECNAMRIIR